MAPRTNTRVLKLNKGENLGSVLYRFEKGWTLRFILGPSLMGQKVRLYTNHPVSVDDKSNDAYRELKWTSMTKSAHDDLDDYAEIKCVRAGPFKYAFILNGEDLTTPCGSGYFQVSPSLTIGQGEDNQLPLDCIQCVSHLSKLLGPFQEWEGRLKVAKESGYNMIHLTPVQVRGESDSAYSLANQLELDPCFSRKGKAYMSDVKSLVQKIENEWKILTICDVVWNHTASNSPWLKEHPEAAYNVINSSHLVPAFVLDRALQDFGKEVATGKWESRGIPPALEHFHMETLKSALRHEFLPRFNFHEFYQLDIEKIVGEFRNEIERMNSPSPKIGSETLPLTLIQDAKYRRFCCGINMPLALMIYNCERPELGTDEIKRQEISIQEFRHRLEQLNIESATKCWEDIDGAINALMAHVDYERIADYGLKVKEYTVTHPLFPRYFVVPENFTQLNEEEMYDPAKGSHFMACNGWVMGDDPLKNFAEPPSMVYFRRELIAWGDSVKLRYGKKPEDSPYLWEHMSKYSRMTAETFHGLRLDNCHSTPIHVAEYLLAEARKIRPELYVIAELFTASEAIDNIFVNRLGITSCVREAQSAPDAHEQGRLVYRFGGSPLAAFIQRPTRPIAPSIAHALFMDLTHDNQSPIQKRTVFDLLPTSAFVAMACCATGSNRGYDELVPYHVHVVREQRLYSTWSPDPSSRFGPGLATEESGIIAGKRALNDIHLFMGANGFNEVYVHDMTEDIVAITRHNPQSHQKIIMVARTCFNPEKCSRKFVLIPPMRIQGTIDEIILEAQTVFKPVTKNGSRSPTAQLGMISNGVAGADEFITGTPDYSLNIQQHIKLIQSKMVEEIELGIQGETEIEFSNFPPGSVIVFRASSRSEAKTSIVSVRRGLSQFGYSMRSMSGKGLSMLDDAKKNDIRSIANRMDLQAINFALFRCHEEDADEGRGGGSYGIPNFGSLVYCGIQGLSPLLNDIRLANDLGHPLCGNIRDGDWLADYITGRLLSNPCTKELGKWYQEIFSLLKQLPRDTKPCYFDALINGSYNVLREAVWDKMPEFISEGSNFLRALALGTVAFCGFSRHGKLPKLAASVQPPMPPTKLDDQTGQPIEALTSISAGLPHFACGIFRNWGRDTFIALPGCLLIPGRYDEARYTILSYAGCLRHGLIPNLLGEGTHARYNCRDAVWFWLHAIKLYCESAPEGKNILTDKVSRLYPNDDSEAGKEELVQELQETMQEALEKHFRGIEYRERNAGNRIDEHMKDEGFNIKVWINKETGFTEGGNKWNCGTWMDKMGSSDKAGNRGHPATPRNGAPVELQGLCFAVVSWLEEQHTAGVYRFSGVSTANQAVKWSWTDWKQTLKTAFTKNFFVPNGGIGNSLSDPKLVNKRGIVKDTVGADPEWADYQLRPNFAIAITVAPELLEAEDAWSAVMQAEKYLKGPLGMKTLDPEDWAYNGNYDNANDSTDFNCAKGFNYHQGPEWVWVMGYFLRAKLATAWRLREKQQEFWTEAVVSVKKSLGNHWTHLQQSPWRSLPELTNKDGAYCPGSCPAQAWSVGCILEVLHDLNTKYS